MMLKYSTLLFASVLCVQMAVAQSVTDSLEHYATKAKPGWDQIDIAIGLGRIYVGGSELEKGKEQIAKIYAYADQYNFPNARCYALVLENLIAYLYDYDSDKAIRLCEESIKMARETGDRDALIYASYQLAENYTYEKGENEKALDILLKALDEIDEKVSNKNAGGVHKNLGYVYGLLGDYDKGLHHFEIALQLFQEMVTNPRIDPRINRVSAQLSNPKSHVGYTQNYMGDLYLKMGNSVAAINYKKKALESMIETKAESEIAWMYGNLAKLHSSLGDYRQALEYVQASRIIFESLQISTDLAKANSTMISLLINLEDYQVAKKHAQENLKYYKEVNHQLFYANTLLQMITIQSGLNDLPKADDYLMEAYELITKMDNKANLMLLMRSKGSIALKKEQYDEAKSSFKKAIELGRELNDGFQMANSEYALANVFYYQSQYDSASQLALSALKKVERTKDSNLARDCYLLLSKIYEAQGNYKSAYENHRVFFAYSDSLYTADAQAKLKEEQVRQDIVSFKKEKEMADQNAALLQQQNRIYIIAGVVLLLIMIMIAYLYINLRKVKAKIQLQNTQLKQLNHTKDKFFGIIAHDLRSPLMGLQSVGDQISYFIKKDQRDKLEELSGHIEGTTKKLTELLDNLLNWALLQNGMIPYHPEKVNLKEVADSINSLLGPVAQMKQVTLKNNITENTYVHADNKAVQTILRNIVSNALKFTHSGGEVVIDVSSEGDKSIITINDTGTGISAEQLPRLFHLDKKSADGTYGEKGSGLGLILCKELVELNKGSINVISDPGKGSSFIFNLPNYSEAA